MSEEQNTNKRPRGRPATGQTPKRQVRMGSEWDRAETLALRLARHQGAVRHVVNRSTGVAEDRGDLAGYAEEAIRRHNDHVERLLDKAEQAS